MSDNIVITITLKQAPDYDYDPGSIAEALASLLAMRNCEEFPALDHLTVTVRELPDRIVMNKEELEKDYPCPDACWEEKRA